MSQWKVFRWKGFWESSYHNYNIILNYYYYIYHQIRTWRPYLNLAQVKESRQWKMCLIGQIFCHFDFLTLCSAIQSNSIVWLSLIKYDCARLPNVQLDMTGILTYGTRKVRCVFACSKISFAKQCPHGITCCCSDGGIWCQTWKYLHLTFIISVLAWQIPPPLMNTIGASDVANTGVSLHS